MELLKDIIYIIALVGLGYILGGLTTECVERYLKKRGIK